MKIFMQIDDTDRRILRHWLAEPGLDRAALADRAGVTAATLWRRLDRLRGRGDPGGRGGDRLARAWLCGRGQPALHAGQDQPARL
jgi:hypothetical protein